MAIDPTERFTDRAEDYARYRPTYPPALLDILREECGLTPDHVIADVGAGTGLLTARLLTNGNPVLAVEPNDAMRQAAEAALGAQANFTSVAGRSEATTLPDRSVDFITVAQALHWFEPTGTYREFHRILRPEGWLIVVNNQREVEASPLLQATAPILHGRQKGRVLGQGWWGRPETNVENYFAAGDYCMRTCGNEQVLDERGFLGRWLSQSTVPQPGQAGHEELMTELRRLFREHQVEGKVTIPYVTQLYLGHLREA